MNASLSLNVLDHEDTLDFLASETYFDANEHETKRMEPDYEKVQANVRDSTTLLLNSVFLL